MNIITIVEKSAAAMAYLAAAAPTPLYSNRLYLRKENVINYLTSC